MIWRLWSFVSCKGRCWRITGLRSCSGLSKGPAWRALAGSWRCWVSGRPWAVLAGLSEFGGGVLTALGLLHPLGEPRHHRRDGHGDGEGPLGEADLGDRGRRGAPVVNIAGSTALILNGPGEYSLDRRLGIRMPAWLAPLGLALILLIVLYASKEGEEPQQQDEAREGLAAEFD